MVEKCNADLHNTTTKNTNGDAYCIPAPLVHKVLWGIVSTLIILCGYMAAWYVDDRLWKQETESRLVGAESAIGEKILPEARRQLDQVKLTDQYIIAELDEIEEKLDLILDQHDDLKRRVIKLEK